MNKILSQRLAALVLLLALSSFASYAQTGRCPANGRPLPTAAERQFTPPIKLLRCFLTVAEINLIRSSHVVVEDRMHRRQGRDLHGAQRRAHRSVRIQLSALERRIVERRLGVVVDRRGSVT